VLAHRDEYDFASGILPTWRALGNDADTGLTMLFVSVCVRTCVVHAAISVCIDMRSQQMHTVVSACADILMHRDTERHSDLHKLSLSHSCLRGTVYDARASMQSHPWTNWRPTALGICQ